VEELDAMRSRRDADGEIARVGDQDGDRPAVQLRLPGGKVRAREDEMAGSRGLDARRGAVRLDGFDGNGRGRGRGAVAVLLARQDNVRLGSESLRANEIQRPRERPSPVLPASPGELLGRA